MPFGGFDGFQVMWLVAENGEVGEFQVYNYSFFCTDIT